MRNQYEPGQKFGRLELVSRVPKLKPTEQQRWKCLCECGKVLTAYQGNLITGKTTSCGCYRKQVTAALGARTGAVNGGKTRTHGMRSSPEYRIWGLLKNRVSNPESQDYANYGGRGIKFDPRWASFDNFYADMGDRPGPGFSIDRIDNEGDYCKSNCRWATSKTQNRNRRDNVLLDFDGRTQCVAAWAEELKLNAKTLYQRLADGWSIEKTLTTPTKKV